MESILTDKRFAHIAKDPKFRRIPKSKRKVKIDKRFQSMFKDKKFAVKYTVDKRGRPVNQTSVENLRKYYDISSSEEESLRDETNSVDLDNQSKTGKIKIRKKKSEKTKIIQNETNGISNESNKEESDVDVISSNGSLLLVKNQKLDQSVSEYESDKDSAKGDNSNKEFEENEKQLSIIRKNEKTLDKNIKEKLHDLTVDYARGEGVLISDSSSDEESSSYESDEEEIEHNWGELDKEAETTDEITSRLAACNMDWDRIRAVDLMVLFNSFLPTGGLVNSVTIYPSEFGLQRLKEEEIKGPIELVESKTNKVDENVNDDYDSENEEGLNYHMEKLRQYQLNRLKYFYAVIVFDSANTANKVYTECDGLEYESSSSKLDLRFIPENMTFDHEPKEICNTLPDLTKYKPRLFTTTALQQVKVDLTWDETNPEREEISQKLNSGNIDNIDKNDIQTYLASASSDEESEDEIQKQLQNIDDSNTNENPIDKYKSLLKSIEQAEEEKKNKEVELEFTWGIGVKEKTEKLVKEKMKQNENLTPFEQYLEKRKAKKVAKREQKNNLGRNIEKSDSEDSVPSEVDLNDPYFAEEFKNKNLNSKKHKKISEDSSNDTEIMKKKEAELELLFMDEDNEKNKRHFNMKQIEEAEYLSKSKKKRLSKKKKELKEQANIDEFEVNVKDSRFNALYTSHHYNIDPADPHYRKTKGTEALIKEKLNRRNNQSNVTESTTMEKPEKSNTCTKINAEISSLIKSIKRNTGNIKKPVV